jgi:hypothetical protein
VIEIVRLFGKGRESGREWEMGGKFPILASMFLFSSQVGRKMERISAIWMSSNFTNLPNTY